MLSGDNSILQKATDAKQTSERAEAKEQARIDIMAWITDKTANHQDSSLDDSKVKSILDGKEYVKEVKDTSFITKKCEYEILYSELYTANDTSKTIKYGLQEDGLTFITRPGPHETDGKTYQVGDNDGEMRFAVTDTKTGRDVYSLFLPEASDYGALYWDNGEYIMSINDSMSGIPFTN